MLYEAVVVVVVGAVVVVVVVNPTQHSLILPVMAITLAETNVGLAISPHEGSGAH